MTKFQLDVFHDKLFSTEKVVVLLSLIKTMSSTQEGGSENKQRRIDNNCQEIKFFKIYVSMITNKSEESILPFLYLFMPLSLAQKED